MTDPPLRFDRCNETKSGFSVENFLVLLGGIMLHALAKLDANKMLSPSPPPYCGVSKAEDNFISGWTARRITSLHNDHKGTRKEGDLTYEQLYGEVRKWCVLPPPLASCRYASQLTVPVSLPPLGTLEMAASSTVPPASSLLFP